jgi:hypothetical protein
MIRTCSAVLVGQNYTYSQSGARTVKLQIFTNIQYLLLKPLDRHIQLIRGHAAFYI